MTPARKDYMRGYRAGMRGKATWPCMSNGEINGWLAGRAKLNRELRHFPAGVNTRIRRAASAAKHEPPAPAGALIFPC